MPTEEREEKFISIYVKNIPGVLQEKILNAFQNAERKIELLKIFPKLFNSHTFKNELSLSTQIIISKVESLEMDRDNIDNMEMEYIKNTYLKSLHKILSDSKAINWIHENFKEDLEHNLEENPLAQFRDLFHTLGQLIEFRLMIHHDKQIENLHLIKNNWTKVQDYKRQARILTEEFEILKIKHLEKERKHEEKVKEIKDEISSIHKNYKEYSEKINKDGEFVKREIYKIWSKKINETKICYSNSDVKKSGILSWAIRGENEFCMKRKELENILINKLKIYDEIMTRKQDELDRGELSFNQNRKRVKDLEKEYEDTDERYDEMRITKKLKELLANIEKADSFKRTRAAQIIQAAWKRYRAKKMKKMKRKGKIKRKSGIISKSIHLNKTTTK